MTSAAHIERAVECFPKDGLAVDTLAVDHRLLGAGAWFPRSEPLDASTRALREMAGSMVYGAVGYAEWWSPSGASPTSRRVASSATAL